MGMRGSVLFAVSKRHIVPPRVRRVQPATARTGSILGAILRFLPSRTVRSVCPGNSSMSDLARGAGHPTASLLSLPSSSSLRLRARSCRAHLKSARRVVFQRLEASIHGGPYTDRVPSVTIHNVAACQIHQRAGVAEFIVRPLEFLVAFLGDTAGPTSPSSPHASILIAHFLRSSPSCQWDSEHCQTGG